MDLAQLQGPSGSLQPGVSDTVAETAANLWRGKSRRSFVVNTTSQDDPDLSAGFRISRMLVDGQDVGPSAIDLSITYTNGQRLSLEDSVLSEVRLIEEGPERAVLWIRGNFLRAAKLI